METVAYYLPRANIPPRSPRPLDVYKRQLLTTPDKRLPLRLTTA